MVERLSTGKHPVVVIAVIAVVRGLTRAIRLVTTARVARVVVGAAIVRITGRAVLVVGIAASSGSTVARWVGISSVVVVVAVVLFVAVVIVIIVAVVVIVVAIFIVVITAAIVVVGAVLVISALAILRTPGIGGGDVHVPNRGRCRRIGLTGSCHDAAG